MDGGRLDRMQRLMIGRGQKCAMGHPRSRPAVIRLVVIMYVCTPRFSANVDNLPFERGICICHDAGDVVGEVRSDAHRRVAAEHAGMTAFRHYLV